MWRVEPTRESEQRIPPGLTEGRYAPRGEECGWPDNPGNDAAATAAPATMARWDPKPRSNERLAVLPAGRPGRGHFQRSNNIGWLWRDDRSHWFAVRRILPALKQPPGYGRSDDGRARHTAGTSSGATASGRRGWPSAQASQPKATDGAQNRLRESTRPPGTLPDVHLPVAGRGIARPLAMRRIHRAASRSSRRFPRGHFPARQRNHSVPRWFVAGKWFRSGTRFRREPIGTGRAWSNRHASQASGSALDDAGCRGGGVGCLGCS